MGLAVIFGRGGFRTYGRGIQQHLCPHQRHRTGAFGEPLIPANPQTDAAHGGVPHAVAGVTGAEIELLFITNALRDMAFAVVAQDGAIGIDEGAGIEKGRPRLFEIGTGQHHTQFACKVGKAGDQRVAHKRLRHSEILGVLFDAKIGAGEQLLDQNQLGPLCGGLAHQSLGLIKVRGQVPCAGKLRSGEG